jgi:hypothetical protein
LRKALVDKVKSAIRVPKRQNFGSEKAEFWFRKGRIDFGVIGVPERQNFGSG